MKLYEIDTMLLQSMSVSPSDICAVELKPGEAIWCRDEKESWDVPVALIADRVCGTVVHPTCTMVRQVLPVGSRFGWCQKWREPNRNERTRCRILGCERVTVPGGIPPLVPIGYVAVPDFKMSGTSWYIIPESSL